MIFDDLLPGDALFLDANILVYFYSGDPVFGGVCGRLLQRIENKELTGFISTHVFSEMAHRLMTIQAILMFGWAVPAVAKRLRQKPADISKLTLFRRAA